MAETKEMVIDFRRTMTHSNTISVLSEEEVVDSYTSTTEAVYRKGQSRLGSLTKLRSGNVGSRMLQIFYQCNLLSCFLLGQ